MKKNAGFPGIVNYSDKNIENELRINQMSAWTFRDELIILELN